MAFRGSGSYKNWLGQTVYHSDLVTYWYLLTCSDKRRGYVNNKSQESKTCAFHSVFYSLCCLYEKFLCWFQFYFFWDPQNKARKSTTQAVPPPLVICLEEMDSVHLTIAVSLPQCRIWHNFLSFLAYICVNWKLFFFFKAVVYGINLNNSAKLKMGKVCSMYFTLTCLNLHC